MEVTMKGEAKEIAVLVLTLQGRHVGENSSTTLTEALEELGIAEKLGGKPCSDHILEN